MEEASVPDFSDCIGFADNVGYHIHPDKLLQLLEEYARVFAERTAIPNLTERDTDLLRGQRLLALIIAKEIREARNKWQTQKI